jgi:hypothetical protein
LTIWFWYLRGKRTFLFLSLYKLGNDYN